MSPTDDASDDFLHSPLACELRIGQVTIPLDTKSHDDIAWTSLEPAADCDTSRCFAETIRLEIQVTGDSSKPPDSSTGEGDGPPPPQPKPPVPPQTETPS